MAEERSSNNTLYFIVGALLVIVAVIAFFVFSGRGGEAPTPQAPEINVEVPSPS